MTTEICRLAGLKKLIKYSFVFQRKAPTYNQGPRVGIPGQPIHGPSMDHRIPIDGPSMVRRPFCHGPSMAHRWAIHGTILSSHRWAIAIFARV